MCCHGLRLLVPSRTSSHSYHPPRPMTPRPIHPSCHCIYLLHPMPSYPSLSHTLTNGSTLFLSPARDYLD
ncbi:hypothetical protein PAXRUDRAFT_676908 [Paxillus rubicundulus Ve08.2h10]|uniref:Uncharacterized protein n=1 Tax=Paxillus rubicundulus Ve08.2h10 TaxID=930991 RepID=A0A0D0D202_9AGAM|nr:hypothetical protein PAXRUDRAFT_676908 [Paxillus rubicundulus Ve08.2h10]